MGHSNWSYENLLCIWEPNPQLTFWFNKIFQDHVPPKKKRTKKPPKATVKKGKSSQRNRYRSALWPWKNGRLCGGRGRQRKLYVNKLFGHSPEKGILFQRRERGEGEGGRWEGGGGKGSVKLMLDSYVFLLPTLTWLLGSLKFRTILLPSICISLIVSDFHSSSQSKPYPSHCRIPINSIRRRGPRRWQPEGQTEIQFFFCQSEALFIILVFCSPYPEPKKKTVVGKESRKKRSSGKVSINEYFWVTFPVWLREAVHNLVFKLPTETFPFLLFSSCSSRTHQSEEAFVLTKICASSLIIRNT